MSDNAICAMATGAPPTLTFIYLGFCAQHTLEPHPSAPIATIAAAAVTTVATASVAVAVT